MGTVGNNSRPDYSVAETETEVHQQPNHPNSRTGDKLTVATAPQESGMHA